MASFVRVAATGDLGPGQGMRVEIQGKRIALFNVGGTYYALDDTCPHRGGPLSEGQVEGDAVVCPWHGARFRIPSGEVLAPPARTGVSCYPVCVNGSNVEVEL